MKWFYHGDLSLGTDPKNVQKKDFGLLWRDYKYTNCGSDRVHWEDVEVVGEHIDQQHSVTKKTVKLAEYARHALLHQPNCCFIFGFLVHRSDLYLYLFTSVGVISSKPFSLLQDFNTLQILIQGITHLPTEKRGRDINFNCRRREGVIDSGLGGDKVFFVSSSCEILGEGGGEWGVVIQNLLGILECGK